MNIESQQELHRLAPPGFRSLNDACLATNTNRARPKPYDHVLFRPAFTTEREIEASQGLNVIDLPVEMKAGWAGTGSYPGDPYHHDLFRAACTDHHAVWFRITLSLADDD
ncbi:MAG: hypothetical protein QM754_07855 [Tepidisphaeraceae bacterium]